MAANPLDVARAYARGLRTQAKGIAEPFLHPIQTAQDLYATGESAISDPRAFGGAVVGALRDTVNRAKSSPEGFAEVAGENISPFSVLRGLNKASKLGVLSRAETKAQYGDLVDAPDKASRAQWMRNQAPVVEERIAKAEEFLKQPTEPWQAREYAFSRAPIKDALEGWPGVEQTRFPRYKATGRTDLSHVQATYDDPRNRAAIKAQILRGLPLGGETFYASLYPVALEAAERGVPMEDAVRWIEATSGGSARNTIVNEQAVGNALMRAELEGQDITDPAVLQAVRDSYRERTGVGLPAMPVHAGAIANVLRGNSLSSRLAEVPRLAADVPEYKLPTYGRNKAGDFRHSATLDVHEAQGQTLGSPAHPYFAEQGGFGAAEYGPAEEGFLSIASELGIPGGMAQAGRWFGGGELTGLASPRGDALDILEKQVAYTLKKQGKDVTPQAVRDYTISLIRQGGDLLPYFARKTAMPDYRF
jgi:hypothetical protein